MEHGRLRSGDIRRPWRRRITLAAAIVGTLALTVHALLPTPREQLAAIDAKRAVADANNAALIHAELLRGEEVAISDKDRAFLSVLECALDPASLLESNMNSRKFVELELPDSLLDPNDDKFTLWNPWRSADYPELRQWLDTHRERIGWLLAAARKPACYFPLVPEPNHMGLFDVPTGALGQCVCLLRRDANNDIAEGRMGAALTKYRAMISMGRHFEAQPSAAHLSVGIACEGFALRHLIVFIVTGLATESDLDDLAVDSAHLVGRWKSVRKAINQVRNAFARGLEDHRLRRFRLYQWYKSLRYDDKGWFEDIHRESYHHLLCERRAVNIVIELRRFKNRTGRWPNQLDEVASCVDPLILIDPQNGGSYVYEKTEEGFRLYSTGPNGKDENGEHAWNGPDDWSIWPGRGGPKTSKPEDVNNV